MGPVSARVDWLIGSDKALAAVGSRTTKKNILTRTLRKAAKPIDDQASALAPRDTGKLEVSIITGTRLTRRQRSSAYKAGKLGVAEVHVGTAMSRGMFQEFGTLHATAQPFLRPAWDAHKGEAQAIIGRELWVEIEAAAKREARRNARRAGK